MYRVQQARGAALEICDGLVRHSCMAAASCRKATTLCRWGSMFDMMTSTHMRLSTVLRPNCMLI